MEILQEITTYMKYARYVPRHNRRETWEEIVNRNILMHIKKYPQFEKEIRYHYQDVFDKKVLPSMRSLQLAGKAIEKHNNRMYNCCYLPINCIESFSEIFFLLLCGCGVGFSVQNHHINDLPEFSHPTEKEEYIIEDSIEGWADSVKVLMNAYLNKGKMPEFDYNKIRSKGSVLLTTGGYAPGYEPLKKTLDSIIKLLEKKQTNKLTSLECHDIICYIAESVYAGGIRRSALISLFSKDDTDMINCKNGSSWFIDNKQRCMSNNSIVLLRKDLTEVEFKNLFKMVEKNKTGEPGIYLTNDLNSLTNPCSEISLGGSHIEKIIGKKMAGQFCNLCEINCSNIESQDDLNKRVITATFIGTLQATYTNFNYLREEWKTVTELEALLGVSLTGIASSACDKLDFKMASKLAKKTNIYWAKLFGINPAARITTIKPAGTTSLVLGCSSGIHPYHSPYYIRRIRIGKNEPLYKYLVESIPNIIEDDVMYPNDTAVISIPVKTPKDSIYRDEYVIDFLERIKKYYINWIIPSHVSGPNTHNISATVSVKNDEWDIVVDWMWNNKNYFNGLTVLPHYDIIYKQTPFEECTEETYNELAKSCNKIDLTSIKEDAYRIKLQESACSGGQCEIFRL